MDDFKNKVVWKEGMFISPQHFQQHDRFIQSYVQSSIDKLAGTNNFYGVTELSISHDSLLIGQFSVNRCSGIFPDGTLFSLTREIVLDIPEGTINELVYLALPLSLMGSNEYSEHIKSSKRYVVKNVSVFDSSAEETTHTEIDVADLNIVLKLTDDDTAGYNLLPIARILEYKDTGQIILDKNFIPASLHYGTSSFLIDRIREIHILVKFRTNNLVSRIENSLKQKSQQSLLIDYIWLQTLNTWLVWLDYVILTPKVHIHDLYLGLLRFQGELLALNPELPPSFETLKYDKLFDNFNPLLVRLRDILTIVQNEAVIEFTFNDQLFEKRRILQTIIKNSHQLLNRRFIFSVKSSIAPYELGELFPSSATLSSKNKIPELVKSSLSGIEVKSLSVVPSELKPMPDVAYFEIDVNNASWQSLLKNNEVLALHIDMRIPNLTIKLYALG